MNFGGVKINESVLQTFIIAFIIQSHKNTIDRSWDFSIEPCKVIQCPKIHIYPLHDTNVIKRKDTNVVRTWQKTGLKVIGPFRTSVALEGLESLSSQLFYPQMWSRRYRCLSHWNEHQVKRVRNLNMLIFFDNNRYDMCASFLHFIIADIWYSLNTVNFGPCAI